MKGAAMRNIEIQKDSSGYVLRFNRNTRRLTMVISGCLFLPGMTVSLVPWLIHGSLSPAYMVFISICTGVFAIGIPWVLVCPTIGFRLVVDAKGVHRYSFNRLKRTFLWRHVRSYGIDEIPPSANEGRLIPPSFYVSTEKEIENMKNCLFIRLRHKEDEQALRASGLLNFCRAQMAKDDKK